MNNDYIVYLLINSNNKYTYLGITNNSIRRLRQHNSEIKGGAKYTSSKKGDGIWLYYLHIKDLTKSEALSLERRTKNMRKNQKENTIRKRIYALTHCIQGYDYKIITL